MQCTHCQSVAQDDAKFCRQCGHRLVTGCPQCGASNPAQSRFCGDCGQRLDNGVDPATPQTPSPPDPTPTLPPVQPSGERRHVTVLFTDLTGYSTLMEQHDPEDVQSLMASIIKQATQIIEGYDGHMERILGDEIMALFGLPAAHEDDPIRAIKAAEEIHRIVETLVTPGMPLTQPARMHTGINTGLVVTAHTAVADGLFEPSGDSVNLASRLADLAAPGEILVGPETYRQAFGFFEFNKMTPVTVKGRSAPVPVYTVAGSKNAPLIHKRAPGRTAALIGRRAELSQLANAVERLGRGNGTFCAVVGEAGTGKSRLVDDFQNMHSPPEIQWVVGHAFAHTQQIPYFPLIDLIQRWLRLEDTTNDLAIGDSIAKRIGDLMGSDVAEIPIIQGLMGLEVPQSMVLSPDEWRQQLATAVERLLSAIAGKAPTVFYLEDLHWADTASLTLFRTLLDSFGIPAMLICTFRPHFNLFTSHQIQTLAQMYQEIRLTELSASESEDMMASLLEADRVPLQLSRLVRERAEGNPFYMEEILNALIDSDTLVAGTDGWELNRHFRDADIPSTIHGVIASRLDQLDSQSRRILQEAAVIGRAFVSELLKAISAHGGEVDHGLHQLERGGLILPRALLPEMEFMFKHALIQEVSYRSLLRKERRQVHAKIGQVMEELFSDRLSEFDEALADHFQKGGVDHKAIDYLMRSGVKALRRCALEESDNYFRKARSLLENQPAAAIETKRQLLDVVNQWAFVFYFKGHNRKLLELLQNHQSLVDDLQDPKREGMYWAWRGCALWHRHRFAESYTCLDRARRLGETADLPYVTGYACTWLSWPCTELGRLDEAITHSDTAADLYRNGRVRDPYIYFHALAGKGYASWHLGKAAETRAIGNTLLDFGKRHTNARSRVAGHCCRGWADLIEGAAAPAAEAFDEAVRISTDPWYSQFPKLALCYGHLSNDRPELALPLLDNLIAFSDTNGAEFVGEPARFFQGIVDIGQGKVAEGLGVMESLLAQWEAAGNRLRYLTCGFVLARTYMALAGRTQSENPPMAAGFQQKALDRLAITLALAEEMRAAGMIGQASLGIGEIHMAEGRWDMAKTALERAQARFESINASVFLADTQRRLADLGGV